MGSESEAAAPLGGAVLTSHGETIAEAYRPLKAFSLPPLMGEGLGMGVTEVPDGARPA